MNHLANGNRPTCWWPPKGSSMAVVRLVLHVTDEEFGPLELVTWTAGKTGRKAVSNWRRQHPLMAADLHSSEVVTPKNGARVVYRQRALVGPRVEVHDAALEACAELATAKPAGKYAP